ncbi:MAG: hypothetical protein AABX30_00015 [Nanoarchaeota archaeon]
MAEKRAGLMILVLIAIIIILLGIVTYIVFVKPSLNGYIVNKQLEAKDIVLNSLLMQIQQRGYAEIVFGNQSLILVPYQGQTGQEKPKIQ